MKLLFDQNISHKVLSSIWKLFPWSSHVYLLWFHTASDHEIWQYAKINNYTIVTQDSDFYNKSLLFWFPPKIIWIRTWNISTDSIITLFKDNHYDIHKFEHNANIWCMEIY